MSVISADYAANRNGTKNNIVKKSNPENVNSCRNQKTGERSG